jgi:hypothetical protein
LLSAEKALLDSLKQRLAELQEKAAFVEAHAAALSLSVETVAAGDEAAADAALAAWEGLSEAARALAAAEKALLDNLKLAIEDARNAENAGETDKAAAAGFVAAHEAVLGKTIDTIAVGDEAAVDAALAAHNALGSQAKALVGARKALLDSLKTKITDSKAAAAFKTAHAAALAKDPASAALEDEPGLDAVLAAYEGLSAGAKALLASEKAALDALKQAIGALKEAAGLQAEADAFAAAHAAVLGKTIDTIAVGDEAAADTALAAYEGLSAGAKALLAREKAALDALKQAIGALKEAAALQAEADAFAAAHGAVLGKTIDTIAVGDEASADAALAAYQALDARVRALLAGQKSLLDSLKAKLEALKAPAAADGFRKAHAGILGKTAGSVAVGDEAAANAALLDYSNLSAPAKEAAAPEKALLDSLRQAIAALKDTAADQNAAALFRASHAAILSKTADAALISDQDAVDAALAAYAALRQGAKTLAATEKTLLDQLKAKITERIEREGIFTAADLAKIGVDPGHPASGSYTLMADLALSNWAPLGSETSPFSGAFDGNGHTIALASFSSDSVSNARHIGLFGYVKGTAPTAKALIRNIKISSSVDASSAMNSGQSLGLIAGYANMAVIENISLEGSLRFSALIGVAYVGGVAGWIEQEAVARDCDSSMSINVTGGYDAPLDPNIVMYSSVGGFVGLFKHRSEIRSCHNTAAVSANAPRPSAELVASRGGTSSLPDDFMGGGGSANDPNHAQVYVGGIAGGAFFGFSPGVSGNIYDCSSYGDITAVAGGYWAFAAGISGCFQGDASQGGVRMENCTAGGTIKAASQWAYVGGMTCYGDGGAVYYRCNFVGAIAPGNYYAWGPITGQYGQAIECAWNSAPEPAPQASLDLSGKLAGLAANMDYTVNGAAKRSDPSGGIAIEEAWFGSTVAIVKKKANLAASGDSQPQSLFIPARAAAPAGLSAGSSFINGVNAAMEWAPFGTDAWTACAGNSVVGLAPGTYYVRLKQSSHEFASANAVLAVSLSILSAEELAKIGADPAYPVNGAYTLGADLYLSNWAPLAFSGGFDGNGRRITINSFNPQALAALNSIGVFSAITGPSHNTPVLVEDLNISVGNGAYAALNGLAPDSVGALAGKAEYVLIRGVHVDGAAIEFNANDGYLHSTSVGGIVGEAVSVSLTECGNTAAIRAGASIVGGIAGTASGQEVSPSLLEACHAAGAIAASSAESPGAMAGGIAGKTLCRGFRQAQLFCRLHHNFPRERPVRKPQPGVRRGRHSGLYGIGWPHREQPQLRRVCRGQRERRDEQRPCPWRHCRAAEGAGRGHSALPQRR